MPKEIDALDVGMHLLAQVIVNDGEGGLDVASVSRYGRARQYLSVARGNLLSSHVHMIWTISPALIVVSAARMSGISGSKSSRRLLRTRKTIKLRIVERRFCW